MKTCKYLRTKGLISIVLLMTIAWNCENVKEYTDPKDNIPPGKVTAVEVENLHGGAMITYTLPADDDLLGVKAVFSLREGGKEYEVFSSAHRDTIFLAGFPNTNERVVNLYAIDLSRNLSEPVPVTIQPLMPPVELVRKSLKVVEVFGGVYCSWENIMRENIAVSLYVSSDGDLALDDTYFSSSYTGGCSFRGFPNEKHSFRIEIRDKWQNYSIPLDTVLTPLFEEPILARDPATGQIYWSFWGVASKECLSRGDAWNTPSAANNFNILFDGILFDETNFFATGTDWGFLNTYVAGAPGTYVWPLYYTLDMGRPSMYSRYKKYVRKWPISAGGRIGDTRHVYEFEIWGTNDPKPLVPENDPSDRITNLQYWTSWPEIGGTDEWKNDWVKLADVSYRTPSGAIVQTDNFTAEDDEFISNGFNIDFDVTHIPCRYLRFVCKKSSRSDSWYENIGELEFFGAVVK